jgi:hypothetical protein
MIVLKGHLLVEQLLTSLLSRQCHSPGELKKARRRFPQKVALLRAMLFPPFPDEFWTFAELLNQLRNDIAHELEPELRDHLKTVRAMANEKRKIVPVPDQFKATFESDEGSLRHLISFWLGALGAADSVFQLFKRAKGGQQSLP